MAADTVVVRSIFCWGAFRAGFSLGAVGLYPTVGCVEARYNSESPSSGFGVSNSRRSIPNELVTAAEAVDTYAASASCLPHKVWPLFSLLPAVALFLVDLLLRRSTKPLVRRRSVGRDEVVVPPLVRLRAAGVWLVEDGGLSWLPLISHQADSFCVSLMSLKCSLAILGLSWS